MQVRVSPGYGTRAPADAAGGRVRPVPAGAPGQPAVSPDAGAIRLRLPARKPAVVPASRDSMGQTGRRDRHSGLDSPKDP